ncbi:Ger(x)C family spore germination protein [Bacillus smithii]|uniref:Ger(x)C family spore germination protein n=1 Tax=Bacillus smithii TaxID=1479 RepID=UPI003D1B961F
MIRKRSLLLMIVCVQLLLSGCWSEHELSDLAFVLALGIDKTEDGKYEVSLQIVNPGNVAGATQQVGGGGQGLPIVVYHEKGDNIVEAIRKNSELVSRRLYFSHTNMLILGEKVAKNDIVDILDALEREQEFRVTTDVVIARGTKAQKILETLTPVDKIPADQIRKTLSVTHEKWGQTFPLKIFELIEQLVSPGKQPVVPGIALDHYDEKGGTQENVQKTHPYTNIVVNGLALMKDGKLKKWVYGETARGVSWTLGKVQSTDVTIDWKGKKEAISYEVLREKSKLNAKVKNGKPVGSVLVKVEGNIGEVMVPIDITNLRTIEKLEKRISEEIRKEVERAIKTAQRNHTDVFGFGEAVHRSDPKFWKKEQMNWGDHYFPNMKITVKAKAHIRRSELRTKPFLSTIKEEKRR